MPRGKLQAGPAQALGELFVREHTAELGSEGGRVVRRREQRSAVVDELSHTADGGRNERRARGQCFERDEREPLCARREHDRVGGADQLARVGPEAGEDDALLDARVPGGPAECVERRPFADDRERGVVDLGERADRKLLVLDRHEAADGEQKRAVGRDPPLLRERGAIGGRRGRRHAVEDRRRRLETRLLEPEGDSRAARHDRQPGEPEHLRRAAVVLVRNAVDADEAGRAPAAQRRGTGRGRDARVVAVHEVGSEAMDGPTHGEDRARQPGEPALDERQRVVLPVELRDESALGGSDRDLVPGRLRPLRERDDDPLGAARPQLLDGVQDPHQTSFRYSSTICRAIDRASKCSTIRVAPACPSRCLNASSDATRSSASASPAASSGSTSSPVSPSTTTSGTPPTRVATTGSAAAMASRIAIGRFSPRLGSTKTSSSAILSSTSETKPGNSAASAEVTRESIELGAQRAVSIDHQAVRRRQARARLEEDVDPLAPLEQGGSADHDRVVGRRRISPPDRDPVRDHVEPLPRKAVCGDIVRERLRRDDHCPEVAEERLHPQQAVLEPQQSSARSRRVLDGRRRPTRPKSSSGTPWNVCTDLAWRPRASGLTRRPVRRSWVWTMSAPASSGHVCAAPAASSLFRSGRACASTPAARNDSAMSSSAETTRTSTPSADVRREVAQVRQRPSGGQAQA